jgi:hypothetical protein
VSELQWGVRTVYADGSQGIDWTNEDDARSFLSYYAEHDSEPGMRVARRDLVCRPIVPGDIEVVETDYPSRRRAAEERVGARWVRSYYLFGAGAHMIDGVHHDFPYCTWPQMQCVGHPPAKAGS